MSIERQTSLAEVRRSFVREATDAREEMEQSGLGYEAAEVHAYLAARAWGDRPRPPKPGSWRD